MYTNDVIRLLHIKISVTVEDLTGTDNDGMGSLPTITFFTLYILHHMHY